MNQNIKLPNILSPKDIKAIKRGKEALKIHLREVKPEIDKALETRYRPGPEDYDIVSKAINDIYTTNPNGSSDKQLRMKYFDWYHDRMWEKHGRSDKPLDKLSIGNVTFGSFAIPRVVCDLEHMNEVHNYPIWVELPPQFIYSRTLDREVNLLRYSGNAPGKPYKFEFLRTEGKFFGSWSQDLPTEKECLSYLYDLQGYALKYANEKWVDAICRVNNGKLRLRDIVRTQNQEFFSSEWVQMSSKCIPFEIEGELITITVDDMIEILNLYRDEEIDYPFGACKDPKIFILHLLYEKVGLHSRKAVGNYLKDKTLDQLVDELKDMDRHDTIVAEKGKELTKLEILYYYASTEQRESLVTRGLISRERTRDLQVYAEWGMRTMMYEIEISGIDRSKSLEEREIFNAHEDKILEEQNSIYGTNVKRVMDGYSVNDGGYELEEDMFGCFDEIDDEIEEFLDEPEAEVIDQSQVVFETTFSEWNTFGSDPMDLPRYTWDPGGTSRRQDPGRIAPPRVYNEL